ncbi:MAG: PEP-CTERM sorting domain-containing protein [Vicinamibacterales bacterium]
MKKVLFLFLLALPFSAVPASASTMLFNGEIGQNVTIYGPGTLAGSGLNTIAGAAQVSTNGGVNWFDAYCVDLQHFINPHGSFSYTLDSMSNWGSSGTGVAGPNSVVPTAWQQAAWLYSNYASVASASGAYYRAALQLSIWEVLYDTGNFNILALGDAQGFRASNVSSLAAAAANTMLTALQGTTAAVLSAYDANWYRTANPTNNPNYTQDFMANARYTPPPPAVPEPSSFLLLGTGVLGLLGARRLRRARQARD